MNKRQKKKAIKIALNRVGTTELTEKDKRLLKTYGRNEFKKAYSGVSPEVLDIELKPLVETVTTIWKDIRKSFGHAFINIGKNLLRGIEEERW